MKWNQLITVAATGVLLTASGLATAEDLAAKMTDEQITQHLKEKLSADEPGVAARIIVSTRDGVVTLSGFELTATDILTAMHDANDIQGVVRVENHLKLG